MRIETTKLLEKQDVRNSQASAKSGQVLRLRLWCYFGVQESVRLKDIVVET